MFGGPQLSSKMYSDHICPHLYYPYKIQEFVNFRTGSCIRKIKLEELASNYAQRDYVMIKACMQ